MESKKQKAPEQLTGSVGSLSYEKYHYPARKGTIESLTNYLMKKVSSDPLDHKETQALSDAHRFVTTSFPANEWAYDDEFWKNWVRFLERQKCAIKIIREAFIAKDKEKLDQLAVQLGNSLMQTTIEKLSKLINPSAEAEKAKKWIEENPEEAKKMLAQSEKQEEQAQQELKQSPQERHQKKKKSKDNQQSNQ